MLEQILNDMCSLLRAFSSMSYNLSKKNETANLSPQLQDVVMGYYIWLKKQNFERWPITTMYFRRSDKNLVLSIVE